MDWEHAVDELWEKASERFPTSMQALLESFDGDLNKAKDLIKDSLTEKSSSSKNSLHHELIGDQNISSSNRKSRVEGTIALLRTMAQQPELTQFVSSLLQVVPEGSEEGRGNSFLHLAAKNGYCSEFESFIGKEVHSLRYSFNRWFVIGKLFTGE